MIEIKEILPVDALETQILLENVWLDTFPNDEHGITRQDILERFKNRKNEDFLNNYREFILKARDNGIYLLKAVSDKNKIVGIIKFSNKGDYFKLDFLLILPEFHNLGIGKRLFFEALNKIEKDFGKKDIFLNVVIYNQKAISFYEKLGFVKTGKEIREEYFRMKNGVILPEIEMKKAHI